MILMDTTLRVRFVRIMTASMVSEQSQYKSTSCSLTYLARSLMKLNGFSCLKPSCAPEIKPIGLQLL